MDEKKIKERNEAIVKFLGYTYKTEALEDFSDIGGMYSSIIIYSKEPVQTEAGYLVKHQWSCEKDWIVIGKGLSIDHNFPLELIYHKDWNWLDKVAEKICEMGYKISIYLSPTQRTCTIHDPNQNEDYLIRATSSKISLPIEIVFTAYSTFAIEHLKTKNDG